MPYYSIAVDGPSGAGKSTIARAVSEKFGFIYLDTGAIYRTLGLAVKRRGISPKDEPAVRRILPELFIDIEFIDNSQHMLLNGEDVTALLRTPEISMAASDVSALPPVREFLMDLQRSYALKHHVIMDGRDIGTVVLPNAGLKIFLTASAEKRAERRYLELREKGTPCTPEEVLEDMRLRDYNDSHRAAAPLKKAEDAVELDTSDLTLEESVGAVCALVTERFAL